jgi:phage host-nuclease inhibitor protein Gam
MDIETAEAVETLRADIHRVEREVVRVETSLTAKMDEHKVHTHVLLESMHDDIRLLAENLASLSVEVRSLRR